MTAAATNGAKPKKRHMIGLAGVGQDEIASILDLAETFYEFRNRDVKKLPTLRGKTVINFFMEASTRTKISFELAAKRLSADGINFSASSSSTSKGETLRDTALTLNAMHADIIVMRHKYPGSVQFVADHVDASVINGGDGAHEHPTQALLDMFTMRKELGRLNGINVTIVGDITHSRVVRSNIIGLRTMGANVTVVGPPTLMPAGIEELGAEVSYNLDQQLDDTDALMMLRVQLERQKGPLFPSIAEYNRLYGLNSERFAKLKPEAIVMHPGPMNRGVEITDEVADGPRSVVLDQVAAGVAVRMALMYRIIVPHGQAPE